MLTIIANGRLYSGPLWVIRDLLDHQENHHRHTIPQLLANQLTHLLWWLTGHR